MSSFLAWHLDIILTASQFFQGLPVRVKEETKGTASSKPKKKTEGAISKGMGPSFFFLLHAAWSALWCSVDVEDDDVGVLSYVIF